MNRLGKFYTCVRVFLVRVVNSTPMLPQCLSSAWLSRNDFEVSMLRNFLPTFLLPILFLYTVETKAETLEISGVISAKFYKNSAILNTASNWFVVTIDGKNTRIKAGSIGDPAISDFEYGILEKDSYLLINYVTNLLVTEAFRVEGGNSVRVKLAAPKKAENAAMVFFNNGRSPEYEVGMLSPVWMAYCFNLDSHHSGTNYILDSPVFSMGKGFRERGGLADIAYTLNSSSPNMLQTLVEIGDSKRFEILNLPSPSHGFFTNAVYEVSMWTNVAGFAVPHRFHATYDFIMGPSGIINSAKVVFEGAATNIVLKMLSQPAFTIPAVTRVVERRSALVTPMAEFSYTTTNGIFLNREKLLQHEDYLIATSEKSKSMFAPQSYLKWRVITVVMFGVVTLLALAIWWFMRNNNRPEITR